MNASISLDLDNQWAYMKVHGDEGWEKYPLYLTNFSSRIKILSFVGRFS